MMRVLGRLSAAGYHRVALVTEVEQGGSKAMRGLTISCIGHASRCSWGSWHSRRSRCRRRRPGHAVEFISATDFSKLTQGVKNTPKLKVEEPSRSPTRSTTPKPVKQLAPKVADKPEIKPTCGGRCQAGAQARPEAGGQAR